MEICCSRNRKAIQLLSAMSIVHVRQSSELPLETRKTSRDLKLNSKKQGKHLEHTKLTRNWPIYRESDKKKIPNQICQWAKNMNPTCSEKEMWMALCWNGKILSDGLLGQKQKKKKRVSCRSIRRLHLCKNKIESYISDYICSFLLEGIPRKCWKDCLWERNTGEEHLIFKISYCLRFLNLYFFF